MCGINGKEMKKERMKRYQKKINERRDRVTPPFVYVCMDVWMYLWIKIWKATEEVVAAAIVVI